MSKRVMLKPAMQGLEAAMAFAQVAKAKRPGWSRDEYLQFHRECCDRMVAITAKKNADYTSGSDDPFFNFTRVEAIGITDTERGFLTRMFDKLARIVTFVNKGVLQVADESVEDTLLDLANYCILMAGYVRSKRDAASSKTK
jgi:hypothetical protein